MVATVAATPSSPRTPKHIIRTFNYKADFEDLKDICANVYGGTDYMPRIMHRVAHDPGHLVLAAAVSEHCQHADQDRGLEQLGQDQAGPIDAIICGERRGGALFLYGLRVRESTRGLGLGHLLMEAICRSSPEVDAAPPALLLAPDQPETGPSLAAIAAPPAAATATASTGAPPPTAPTSSRGPAVAVAPPGMPQPAPRPSPPLLLSHVVTCTTSYNPAAQRIIGRQLRGPLCEVECWPAGAREAYEEEWGWSWGRCLPEGAPNMLDWIPGVRKVLEADAEAQALLPHWRRAASEEDLRGAVGSLLYDARSSGSDGAGAGLGLAAQVLQPLLWLPMPYDVWPLDSPFVRRELAAGNVWLCTVPALATQPAVGPGPGRATKEAGGGPPTVGEPNGNDQASGGRDGSEVVAVMLLTYFDTLGRVCAGILARDNAAVHAAVAHAGSLQPYFFASILRNPARAVPPQPGGEKKRGTAPDPSFPALYNATDGYRDFWVYGRSFDEQLQN
ncbi:hypothetical protein GPECTOR_23g28 [Gonium pectorale]|uniref:N-acetyltransferase domain-containing protein n=1 Tax=Gonium pectorale TaxID=33097 RepID=A0A150GGY5_GONPE|nr:hypothetical protein GPECTOR_23g28 [Gonium pectorale]|eukprot:KXZ49096.1 hypothetical protein GPECTOR_23g28 [Gonium pectorale]